MTLSFRRSNNATGVFGLGSYPSGTILVGGDGIFDIHPAAHTYAGHALYSCIFIHNNNPTDRTYSNIVISPSIVGSAKSSVTIGLGTSAAANYVAGSAPAEQTIASPYIAPVGVTFGSSVTVASLIKNTTTYSNGQVKALWLKRVPIAYTSLTATNGINGDGDLRLNVTGTY